MLTDFHSGRLKDIPSQSPHVPKGQLTILAGKRALWPEFLGLIGKTLIGEDTAARQILKMKGRAGCWIGLGMEVGGVVLCAGIPRGDQSPDQWREA